MGIFQDEVKNIASESAFTSVQLEKLFTSDSEREAFLKVRSVLVEATNTNEATKRIIELGADAVDVLVKVGKFVLTA